MFKSLESLEKDYWVEPEDSSYLITTCHQLRKKQLKYFSTEDLRIMIGQSIGLKFLIPIALETLQKNILAEGDFYDGDLLKATLTSDKEYWKTETSNWQMVCALFEENRNLIETYDTTKEIRKGLLDAFAEFEKIN